MNREGQTSLFDVLTVPSQPGLADPSGFPLPNIPEWSQDQLLKYERELTGFYITAHPLTRTCHRDSSVCHRVNGHPF